MRPLSASIVVLASLALCLDRSFAALPPRTITNLVTFGDSYTDVVNTGDGGTAWPTYAVQYASSAANATVTLYPFAKSGATCSNQITYRPFPSLFESQLPAYYASLGNGTFQFGVDAGNTLYTLWIGTNDVGSNALLTGPTRLDEAGDAIVDSDATIVDTITCAVNWVKVLYEHGARNYLFQNMIPLETVPTYSPHAYPTKFWTAPRNATEWSVFMRELTTSGNKIAELLLKQLAPGLEDAHLGLFDAHALFADMYNNPADYLNGTAPLNVTGAVHACVYEEGQSTSDPVECTTVQGTDRDSYLWYDELHPSEQADRIVAQQIAEVILGEDNIWTTWLS
ncbi:GDSL lipase/esterase [Schizophyllum fasciatum]